jgi:mannose-1-phosphate guanylyltransferase / mannose-6-phosphate isomerase
MCGGVGTRLWPASREGRPKQFLPPFGAHSTFQDTLQESLTQPYSVVRSL